jgi:hypothetical protein
MESISGKRFYSFRADANALGGYLETPFVANIPTLTPVSLPTVGGFAMARSEAFTLDEIVRCSSAYTRVSGRENADESASILVRAVVNDLNIRNVVTATRIVAQVSITLPKDKGPPTFSLAGSCFEDLRVAGPGGAQSPDWPDIQRIGQTKAAEQAQNYQWLNSDPTPAEGGGESGPQANGGGRPHRLVIPGFGRIILGELLLSRDSVQLVAIRADLGCPVTGRMSICCVGGGGVYND